MEEPVLGFAEIVLALVTMSHHSPQTSEAPFHLDIDDFVYLIIIILFISIPKLRSSSLF
jgi:hypothetical protein